MVLTQGDDELVWIHSRDLAPGDVQVMAGRRMRVATVRPAARSVTVYYEDAPARKWANGTELAVLRPAEGDDETRCHVCDSGPLDMNTANHVCVSGTAEGDDE